MLTSFLRSFRSNTKRARNRRRNQRHFEIEGLEDRFLLSANVLYDHPGTTFETELFASNIETTLNGNVVGYGYSISENGVQGPAGGGGIGGTGNGFAVSANDLSSILGIPIADGIAFTADTRIEIASVTKNLTAVTLLKAIENHPFANIDQPFAAYLPSSWTQGNNIEQISIRNLLTHTSGFGEVYTDPTEVGVIAASQVNTSFNSFGGNTYSNLESLVEYGVENFYSPLTPELNDIQQIGTRWYSNANYSLMRMLIPIISGDVSPDETDPLAYADAYRDYANDNILVPAGIVGADLFDTATLQARVYRNVSVDPAISTPGVATGGDQTLVAGAFGWKLTANELAAYLRFVYQEDTSPLQPTTLAQMRDGLLGFAPGNTQLNGNYGAYYGHDGQFTGAGSDISDWQRMRSSVTVFPNDVQASLLVNSMPVGNSVTSSILQNAYDNSFTEVAIAGTNGPDTFTIDVAGGTLTLTIDEGNDGNPDNDEVLTAPVSVLEQLTLVGLNGNDTFIVNQLPHSVELIIDAGRGSDTLELTPNTDFIELINDRITFRGGSFSEFSSDTDTINIHDRNNLISGWYSITGNRFDRFSFDRLDYERVEEINLWTGVGNETIRINSLPVDIDLDIDSGSGNDRVYIGAANISGNIDGDINVITGTGEDRLILDDRFGTIADDFYVIQEDFFQSAVIPVIEWDSVSPPERIILRGSNQDSTTNIQGVLPGVRLIVQGRGGDDTINLHSVDAGGRANLLGGSGNDTIALTPTGRDLDAIQGRVFTSGQGGTLDRVVLHDENNTGNGRSYRFVNNRFDVIGSPFDKLVYTGSVETLELHAGNEDDTFDVRRTSTAALVSVNGNGGTDTLNVAAFSQDLDYINGPLHFSGGDGGIDAVNLFDGNDFGNDNYTMTTDPPSSVTKTGGFQFTHFGVEDVTLNANDYNNTIVIGGAWAIQDTNYTINAGDGADTIIVNASAPMTVRVNGGDGVPDRLHIRGTLHDDIVTMRGRRVEIGDTTVIIGTSLERRTLDTGGGDDLLIMEGRAGVDERFIVQASTTAGSGFARAVPYPPINFQNLEDVDVRGNAGDKDRLQFRGTNQADNFDINPVAQGTANSPVVNLHHGGGNTLLRLRNFRNVGIPRILGRNGADTFRVIVFPNSNSNYAMRDMHLEGGNPDDTGRGSGDTLIVNYNEALFTQHPGDLGPSSGTIRLNRNSDNEILGLIFRDFEEIAGNLNLPF